MLRPHADLPVVLVSLREEASNALVAVGAAGMDPCRKLHGGFQHGLSTSAFVFHVR